MLRAFPLLAALLLFLALPTPSRAAPPTPAQLAQARTAAGSANGRCPVMGGLVHPGAAATYRGETIAFCCPGCRAKFLADPVRYLEILRADPEGYGYVSKWPTTAALQQAKAAAGSANGLCPVMHRPVSARGGTVEVGGQRIAFCCPGCVQKFRASPETYLREMRADPTAYAYDRPGPTNAQLRQARDAAGTANGLCPILKRLVTPQGGSVEYQGQKIGFCCPGCAAKFRADPAGYLRAMQQEPAPYGYLSPAR